ncbi:hypothetical protein [Bradyrhizobium sp.]|uniref:hypothetical protein n=1 Tax=Bradyrhizobium sp. TaxID=376 RepID=UPI00271C398F|nr:hypothetical protein [Bradyrhizobium sp.]MDO9297550.1 hypothetical protein [Bradyrhizobium sp.]
MQLDKVPRQAPQLVPGQFGYAPNSLHLKGNSATVDAANEIKARNGWRVSNLQMGLSGPGYGVNLQPIPNGQGGVQVDLDYRLWSPWSGNTHFSDEIKARNKISGRSQARQAARYGELIAARKALTENARLVGKALQAGGLAFQLGGALLDYHLTQREVQRQLAQGDTYGAGLANARLYGRQTGGVLGAAATGAMLLGGAGAVGGSTVPGPGTIALGTLGILGGGLFGSIFGEEAVQRLYERWMGRSASGGSRTLGTPASQRTNDNLYPASGPTPLASEHGGLLGRFGVP